MTRQRPDHWKHDRDGFYKYMSCETAATVLKNRSLKWSPASAFNDPFDMQFDLHLDFDEDDLVAQCKCDFREILSGGGDFHPEIGMGNLLSELKAAAASIPAPDLENFVEMAVRLAIKATAPDIADMHVNLRRHFGRYKVLCLSERNDSILMWSHYANNHTGIVLRLACLEETDSSWAVAQPINYCEAMPRFLDPDELRALITGRAEPRREAIVERTIFSKALEWQYEREWRVYRPSDTTDVEFLKFNAPEISAVYFGCRATEAAQQEISALALSINPAAKLFGVRKSESQFALEFEPLA